MQDLLIKTRGRVLSEQELDEFLAGRELEIPSLFREFILRYAGCQVQKDTYKERFSFVIILPLKSQRSACIEQIMEGYRLDYDTKEWFPFAIDSGGWMFVLSLSGERKGQVWLDRFDLGEQDKFEFVASSFEEFVEGLEIDNN